MKIFRIFRPSNNKSKAIANNYRRLGDRARDNTEWKAAESAYQKHLEENPEDFAIWVQLGHSFKEQGNYFDAEKAYVRALELRPHDDDALLHLDVMRTNFKKDRHVNSHDLNRGRPQDFKSSPEKAIIFEIDDLLQYLRHNRTLSGIQRVVAGIVENFSNSLSGNSAITFVFTSDSGVLNACRSAEVVSLLKYVYDRESTRETVISMIDQLTINSRVIVPTSGDTYVVIGAFWWTGATSQYKKLKDRGVRIGVLIYDLIPISNPEFCDQNLVQQFTLSFCEISATADFIIAISEFTANQVQKFFSMHGIASLPISVVPLAHTISGKSLNEFKGTEVKSWGNNIASLERQKFVLMVSTLEGRKNHVYLLEVWRRLIFEGLNVPKLVFVGKYGWRSEALKNFLDSTNNLNGKVVVLNHVSDEDLETLYSACLFTAFPSIVEGWGLPIGESLYHGKLCVASRSSSIPEVGGDFVQYFDPYNIEDGVLTFRKILSEPSVLIAKEKIISESFVPRTWSEVSGTLIEVIRANDGLSIRKSMTPTLRQGTVYLSGKFNSPEWKVNQYASNPLRLCFKEGWCSIEEPACWIQGNHAIFEFNTDLEVGSRLAFYVTFMGSPSTVDNFLTISQVTEDIEGSAQNSSRLRIHPLQRKTHRTHAMVGVDGSITIEFHVSGEVLSNHPDPRQFAVGLCAFGFASAADAASRVDLYENMIFYQESF